MWWARGPGGLRVSEAGAGPACDVRPGPDRGPPDPRTIAVGGIFVLLLCFAIYVARPLLFPVLGAILLNLVLSPIVSALRRLRVPTPAGAAIVLLGVMAVIGAGGYVVSGPVRSWVGRAPEMALAAEKQIHGLRGPMQRVAATLEKVEDLGRGEREERIEVTMDRSSGDLLQQLIGMVSPLVVGIASTLILTFFLLASGDWFLRTLVGVLPTRRDKARARTIVQEIQHEISSYLWTITLINAGLGVAVGVALHLLGLPDAALWGAVAGVLNFIPYVGAVIGIIIVSGVSLLTFDDAGQILMAPLAYFALTTVEAWLVTPSLIGRRLQLSPVMVFASLMFWGFVWGAGGLFLAVPVLAAAKITFERIDRLAPYAAFLGTHTTGD